MSDTLFNIRDEAGLRVARPTVRRLVGPTVVGVCDAIAPAVTDPSQIPGGGILRLAAGDRAAPQPIAPFHPPADAIPLARVVALAGGLHAAAVAGGATVFFDDLPALEGRVVGDAPELIALQLIALAAVEDGEAIRARSDR